MIRLNKEGQSTIKYYTIFRTKLFILNSSEHLTVFCICVCGFEESDKGVYYKEHKGSQTTKI